MGFDFSQKSSFRLKAKKLGYITLSKKAWLHATKERDREHVKYNKHLIKETLQNPDNIMIVNLAVHRIIYVGGIVTY